MLVEEKKLSEEILESKDISIIKTESNQSTAKTSKQSSQASKNSKNKKK